MKTVKIIHYPENGNRTTDMFDTESIKVVEGYLHDILNNTMGGVSFDDFIKPDFPLLKYGSNPPNEKTASRCWSIVIYSDYQTIIATMNAEIYIMSEGKTIASFKCVNIE